MEAEAITTEDWNRELGGETKPACRNRAREGVA